MLFESGHFASVWHAGIMALPVTFWLYLFCHFGNQLTECFCNVDHAFYQLTWYQFPLDMQKAILIPISLAHKEIYLRGFASIHCTRDTFKQVNIRNK